MKKALLVGINYVGTDAELRGCINDCNNIKYYLEKEKFDEIKLLIEKEATTENIKKELEWLVSNTTDEDTIFFHYSGHGSQMPCETEKDGFEEIICPYDLDWKKKVINDKTLRDIFNRVPKGANTTVVLDCCHSGTMLNHNESLGNIGTESAIPVRVSTESRNRYLTPPPAVRKKLKSRKLVEWYTSRDINETALLIASCQENQTAADAFINGQFQGAGTAAMLEILNSNRKVSYRNLVLEMRKFMVANGFWQTPELDGSSSLYDFSFFESFSKKAEVVSPPQQLVENNLIDQGSPEYWKFVQYASFLLLLAIILYFLI